MKKIFHVSGMHCVSCEILLEDKIREIKEVKKCKVSHEKGIVIVECRGKVSEDKIRAVIKENGHKMVCENKNQKEKKTFFKKPSIDDIWQIGFISIVFLVVIFIFSRFDIMRFFPALNGQMNFFIAFTVGIVASLSTCLAVTGGIIMSFSSTYKVIETKTHSLFHRSLPQVYFHVGRVGGFAILGGILGAIGGKVNYSVSFTGYLTLFVAMIMFYIGLHILNIVPSITQLGFHLPKSFSRKINKLQKNEQPYIPAIIGALTFFLPCGFTQSMQLAAVASGGFWTGFMIMAFFALGTLPILFSVGFGSSYAQKKNFGVLKKVIGVAIVFFSLYSFNSGLTLAGFIAPLSYVKSDSDVKIADIKKDVQVIKMNVNYDFEPSEFKIKKGIPVRWEITGVNITGCSDEVIIPKLGISSGKLKKGLNVVEFTPKEIGILPFSCWMGMIGGRFIVTDENGKLDKKAMEADSDSNSETKKVAPSSGGGCGGSCGDGGCGGSSCSDTSVKSSGSCGCGK